MMRLDNRVRRTKRTGRPAPSRLLAIRAAALALALAASGSTGCTLVHNFAENFRYSDVWNDAALKFRSSSMSSRSWHRHKNRFCNEEYLDHFSAGYRAGYEDVARGSNGCTPNFPPREYWGWKYQSAEGQKQVASWFSGYPHGARAAEEEGVGNWSQIQMSSNLQSQYVTAGVFPNKGHAVYPITEPACNPTIGAPTPAAVPPGVVEVPGAVNVPGGVEIPGAGVMPPGVPQTPLPEPIPAVPGLIEPTY